MVGYLIKRPVAVIVSFIAIVIVGLVTAGLLPVSLLPEIKIPEITVYITHPNTSAIDLERNIVSGMRMRLQQLPGLEEITSESRDNYAIIRLKFAFGSNTDYSFIEVNDKVDAAMASLPREVRRPKIIKASATDLPVFLLNLSLKDTSSIYQEEKFNELSTYAETVIRRRIEQLNSVAFADITGLSSVGLFIIPDDSKMQSLGVGIDDLTRALDENNTPVSGVTVREGQLQYSLMFRNELRTAEDVKNVLVNVHGKPILLSALANVVVKDQETRGLYLSQGKRAICLALIKSSGARIEAMHDEVNNLATQLIKEYPDISFETSQDQSFLLTYTISNLKDNLLQGAFLAILVMFLFIRDYRSPLLIALTLPVTLIISLFFFYLLGISLNIVSLSGLILGVGMMIDNSIVVIDNILQHRQRGENLYTAITHGTNEVITPMISSTLTSCAIFIPLIFLSGIAGALFYDQAVAIAIGQGISLLVSITLTPTLFNLVHRKEQSKEIKLLKNVKLFDLEDNYVKGFNWIFKHQWLTFSILAFIFIVGYSALKVMDKRQLPVLPQQEVNLTIDWNENIHADENKRRIQNILLHAGEGVVQSNAFIGEQQFVLNRDLELSTYESMVYFKAESASGIKGIIRNLDSIIAEKYSQAVYGFKDPENPFTRVFTGKDGILTARLRGENNDAPLPIEKMEIIKDELEQSINATLGDMPLRSQYIIRARPEMLFIYQIDYTNIVSTLKAAFNSYYVSSLKSTDRYIPMIIGSDGMSLMQAVNSLFVENRAGQPIALKSLVDVETNNDYRTIYGGEEGVYVPLRIESRFEEAPGIMKRITHVVKDHPGVEVGFSGSYFNNQRLLKQMVIILMISVLLLFFILAAQFESLTIPWIVLIELPIDIAFASIVLWIFGNSVNAMSLIGFIVMGGIIINDSILKIDTINQLRKEGYDLLPAIHEGGRRRLKPIIMTALVTVIALVPQMFGSDIGAKLQLPLSLTMLGGMTAGTLVSIWVIPLLYYYMIMLTFPRKAERN